MPGLAASLTLEQLDADPHRALAMLREHEPVSWVPALGGWLVTRHDLALAVMRDPGTFTVQDPRFSTAQIVGPSMLSLDGKEHERHRAPFVSPFRLKQVRERFEVGLEQEADRLIDSIARGGRAELRRAFAGPLAASALARALGLGTGEVDQLLTWYDAIVAGVTEITAGAGVGEDGRVAFASLRERLRAVIEDRGGSVLATAVRHASELSSDELVSNAAILLFGGIETTEGAIANAVLHLLTDRERWQSVLHEPSLLNGALEESLRMEPAASVVDRYATADAGLGGAPIAAGQLVRVSIAAANRDPAVFERPDQFDLRRSNVRRHLTFAQGPHVCLGIHLARLEAQIAMRRLLGRLPTLRLDPRHPPRVRGLVFRKPTAIQVLWR
jgi:cytochrome P450